MLVGVINFESTFCIIFIPLNVQQTDADIGLPGQTFYEFYMAT